MAVTLNQACFVPGTFSHLTSHSYFRVPERVAGVEDRAESSALIHFSSTCCVAVAGPLPMDVRLVWDSVRGLTSLWATFTTTNFPDVMIPGCMAKSSVFLWFLSCELAEELPLPTRWISWPTSRAEYR